MVEAWIDILSVLSSGLMTTIQLSLVTLLVGTVFGLALGLVRALNVTHLAKAVGVFVHLIRGTPFLVQLFIVYFVLPRTGLTFFQMSPYVAGVLALSVYTTAYAAEIARAGFEAVPQGQLDAAKALGMSLPQRLLLVVFPQALRLMIPPAGGLYVVIVKSTSILSVVGLTELVRTGEVLALRLPQDMPLIYLCVAGCYFVFCFPMLTLIRRAEKRIAGSIEGL
ncbi:MAG: amino acid ABC transporter permease [Kiloniellales bacterium]|nr:amino acid ABC transporter permease [Kiloniellales bacterium]